jgi:hypothetical protein
MAQNERQQTGIPISPSESEDRQENRTREGQQQNQQTGDGNYKNIETSVNNRNYFDDDYEVGEEDRISSEEAKTEKEPRVGRGRDNKS